MLSSLEQVHKRPDLEIEPQHNHAQVPTRATMADYSFASIHPPSEVHISPDVRDRMMSSPIPDSPLSSAPNSPPSSPSSRVDNLDLAGDLNDRFVQAEKEHRLDPGIIPMSTGDGPSLKSGSPFDETRGTAAVSQHLRGLPSRDNELMLPSADQDDEQEPGALLLPNTSGVNPLNSPSSFNKRMEKSDIVNRARQVVARRSSSQLASQEEMPEDDMPRDERQAVASRQSAVVEPGAIPKVPRRDEEREAPMDEPSPAAAAAYARVRHANPQPDAPMDESVASLDSMIHGEDSGMRAPMDEDSSPAVSAPLNVSVATVNVSFTSSHTAAVKTSQSSRLLNPNGSQDGQDGDACVIQDPLPVEQPAKMAPPFVMHNTFADTSVSYVDETILSDVDTAQDEDVFSVEDMFSDDDEVKDALSMILDTQQYAKLGSDALAAMTAGLASFAMGTTGAATQDSSAPVVPKPRRVAEGRKQTVAVQKAGVQSVPEPLKQSVAIPPSKRRAPQDASTVGERSSSWTDTTMDERPVVVRTAAVSIARMESSAGESPKDEARLTISAPKAKPVAQKKKKTSFENDTEGDIPMLSSSARRLARSSKPRCVSPAPPIQSHVPISPTRASMEASPTRKQGADGTWWLELELTKREESRKSGATGGPIGIAEQLAALNSQRGESGRVLASTMPTNASKSKERNGKALNGKRSNSLPVSQVAQQSLNRADQRSQSQSLVGGNGVKNRKKAGANKHLEEPPSLRRLNDASERELPFDAIRSLEDEPPSLRRSPEAAVDHEGKLAKPPFAASVQEPSSQNRAMEAPGASSSGNSVKSQASDDRSHSTNSLMNSLDDMVKDLESLTPSRLQNDATPGVAEVAATKRRVAADPDALSDGKPILVKSIDNDFGIPVGDIMLSLLNEDADTSWATRIHDAIWRGRLMRRSLDTKYAEEKLEREVGSPSLGRTSVPVDVDDARVIGGVNSVTITQGAAQAHLKYDDFDDALMLYEDIIFSYYRYFDVVLKKSEDEGVSPNLTASVTDFKPYIGAALHNIGMVHLLQGRHEEAFTHFERAALNRAACLGNGHVDHINSLVKMAICQYALEHFPQAQVSLEDALELSTTHAKTLTDNLQLAEIRNNLGCLLYLSGQTEKAIPLFAESLNAQSLASDLSLYAGSKFSCHSASLNMSITRGNSGFMALVTRDIAESAARFEFAVKEQRLLLKDADATLMSTMDHLVVANLLGGKRTKALQMLRRMLYMQIDAFGPSDMRCHQTGSKITMLENQGTDAGEGGDGLQVPSGDSEPGAKLKKKNVVMQVFKSIRKKK